MPRPTLARGAALCGAVALLATAAAATPRATPRPTPRPAPRHRTAAPPDSTGPRVVASGDSVAGEYLTIVGGCNDCHTPGWDQSGGKTPAADRLVGSPVGYRGPWGTSYASNLRRVVSRIDEARWIEILTTADHGEGRPPMPWMNTAMTNPQDLRAMYRYIKALGPKGERTPRAVPPGQEPTTPFVLMVPQQPGKAAATSQPQGARGMPQAKP